MDALGKVCASFSEKKLRRVYRSENAFKLKDATELPPRVTRGFSLPPAGHECSDFPTSQPAFGLIKVFIFVNVTGEEGHILVVFICISSLLERLILPCPLWAQTWVLSGQELGRR